MVVTAFLSAHRTLRNPRAIGETLSKDIVPLTVIKLVGLLVAYAILLQTLGFLPTSALFLISAIKILSRRSWGFTLVVSLGSLIVIWLIFRIVFTVLLPAGIVPEAEIIQAFRNFVGGRG
jgi:hypothetical protein